MVNTLQKHNFHQTIQEKSKKLVETCMLFANLTLLYSFIKKGNLTRIHYSKNKAPNKKETCNI